MINFFRKIRRKLADDNKPLKYMRYAIGEIVLVVIGILIALSINNWNESNNQKAKEKNLLTELVANLETNTSNLENDINSQLNSAQSIYYLLDYLDNKKPYNSSLDSLFAQADFVTDIVLASSAFETLKSVGLDLIRNDKVRSEIINLFEITYPTLLQETKRYEDQIWSAVSVPLYQKHFRREIKLKATPINYDALVEDKEFTNMLSFRLNLREYSTEQKRITVDRTKRVINLIQNELEK